MGDAGFRSSLGAFISDIKKVAKLISGDAIEELEKNIQEGD